MTNYTHYLASTSIVQYESLNGFVETGVLPDQKSVDSAVSFVSNILVETAKQAGMQIKKGVLPRRSARAEEPFKRIKHPKWHDDDCTEKCRQLNKYQIPLKIIQTMLI